AKLAHGITDTAVTMAAKSHLRGGKPLLLAVSTNDGLSGSAQNIGALLQRKNVYFVPFYQDNPVEKPTSLASNYDLLEAAIEAAYRHEQLQPIIGG
ncbi:MAG: dipicolinate synthase subunit B, partial [Oscillospiraceae bacterium]|nr:dipicolinate synthase subunit B [Oscillospiraceae bacterium]